MLEIEGLSVAYGAIQALQDVTLHVGKGQLVGILGANGAGKTSLLRTISGLARPRQGTLQFEGRDLAAMSPEGIVRLGISHVPEGRAIFPDLTVRENLIVGGSTHRSRATVMADCDRMLEMFPSLARRVNQDGSTLSGGEQQMLALARALMARPRLLLADEVSLGLAPVITKQVFAQLQAMRASGITVLVVEQNAHLVLAMADYVYVLKQGRVAAEGTPAELAERSDLTEAYLGD